MEDLVLNVSLEETRALQERWSQFQDICVMAMKKGKVSSKGELKFLDIKSKIAMLHDGFMTRLDHDQKTGQNLMNILGDCILLQRVANYSDAERQKFQFDWNECFLLLTEQVGTLEEEQGRLAKISKRAYNATKRRERLKVQIEAFLQSIYLKLVMGLVALIMVVWGVPAFNIYDYRELGDMGWSRPAYLLYVNYFHRPVVDEDFEYGRLEELNPAPQETADRIHFMGATVGELSRESFENTTLVEIGCTEDELGEIGELLGSLKKYDKSRYEADRVDVRFFWLLFDTTPDAKRFVELCSQGLPKRQPDDQKRITNEVWIRRKANFIAIGISGHQMRRDYAAKKWHFKETDNMLR
jgi:hypothetical protein